MIRTWLWGKMWQFFMWLGLRPDDELLDEVEFEDRYKNRPYRPR